jgi:uncharacterized membrane protein
VHLSTRYIAKIGIIGSLYAVITFVLAFASYGPIQVRVSEALTVLAYITPAAIPGLFVGCALANINSPAGIVDVVGGSLCTVLAAFLTFLLSRIKKPILAPLPPVLINAFGVSLYLHPLWEWNYWFTVLWVGIGEIAACFILGYPLLKMILKKEKILRMLKA